VVAELDPRRRAILSALLRFLREVARSPATCMTSYALAVCMVRPRAPQPTLLPPRKLLLLGCTSVCGCHGVWLSR